MSLSEDIEDFYNTPLGEQVRQTIINTTPISHYINDNNTLIIGYGVPYCPDIDSNTQKKIKSLPLACSLSSMGTYYWPRHDKNRCVHCNSEFLPFPDQTFDKIVVIHALEHAYHAEALVNEIWRILKGNGKALFIAPNRRSVWSRHDTIPFATGHPYSYSQLSSFLKEHKLTIETISYGLRLLPISRFLPLEWRLKAEYWLNRISFPFGGVLVVECGKRLYTPINTKEIALGTKLRSLKLGSISSQ